MPSKQSKSDIFIAEGLSYLSRLRKPLIANALFTNPKSAFGEQQHILRIEAEGQELLDKSATYTRIALSEQGKQYSSVNFAAFLEKQAQGSAPLAFIIGGAYGLSSRVLDSCSLQISLSTMTLPHRMAFLVLSEQLFRASEIICNSPYHK